MLSLRAISDPPAIPPDVAAFFAALERLPARELVALAESCTPASRGALEACARAARAAGRRDALDGAELAACRWGDRRRARLLALEGDGRAAELTRELAGTLEAIAHEAAVAIVARDLVDRDTYELATARWFGFVPMPSANRAD